MNGFTGIVNFRENGENRWQAVSENQGLRVFFAGVLRNRAELLRELSAPADSPDTAILLELFQRRGEQAFPKLNGAFVFAIWQEKDKTLLLGRDQLGQKFLFYARDANGRLIFSDSLREVISQPGISKEYDLQTLADYFGVGYCPAPATIWQTVRKVPPATVLKFNAGGECSRNTYWKPQYLPKLEISFPEAVEESRRLLEQAIKRCLHDHDKANFLLSGGIDSGVVLGLAAPLMKQPGKAISIAFEEALYDESALAAQTAKRHGIEQIIRKVDPAEIQHMADLLAAAGEPFADSSLLPTSLALQEAGKSARAVFSGDGGDEFFCGYRRLQFIAWRSCLGGIPGGIGQSLAKILQPILPAPSEQRSTMANVARLAQALAMPMATSFMSFQELFSPELRRELMRKSDALDYRESFQKIAAEAQCHDAVEKFDALDIATNLPEDGFRKCDIGNLASGLDLLCPILDIDVVHFALRLPRTHKLNLRERKRPLRAIGREVLPEILLQQGKRGFGTPVAAWFRNALKPDLQQLAASVTDWDRHGWLNANCIQRLVQEHLDSKADHAARLWSLFCLKAWLTF